LESNEMKTGVFAILLLLSLLSTAFAEGLAIYDYGARGSALGGAMLARKPDASAVAHNPALLTRLPGKRAMVGLTAIATGGHINWNTNGQEGRTNVRDAVWPVPHAFYTQQINDDWFLGVGEFSRFGLGVQYPSSWPGRFNVYDITLLTASVNPVVAWKATDKLSVAVGVEFLYATMDMKKRVGVPVAPGVSFEVDSNIRDASDLGLGFNLAAHYQFNDQWAIGLQYRSPVRISAEGDVRFEYMGPNNPLLQGAFNQNFKNGTVKSTVTLPDSLAGGIAFSPTPDISLEAGVVWTRWSSYDSLDIHMPGGMPTSYNPTKWKDTWRITVGLEYEALDWLTLRAGYNWTQSPMTDRYADYTVPTNDRHTYSIGLGFHNENWSVDVAYLYVQCQSRHYRENPVQSGGNGTINSSSNLNGNEFALSIGYKF
jgi:long-chain fatty acid transport protein